MREKSIVRNNDMRICSLPTLQEGFFNEEKPFAPDTFLILDFIEFCYRSIAKPIQGAYHSFFCHHHLSFDFEAGRDAFRGDVNRIFTRNGVAYELENTARSFAYCHQYLSTTYPLAFSAQGIRR